MTEYLKSALSSIWNNKARSVLTVLGVVIGVASVTTLVSLGQGMKQDVAKLIQGFGTNVVVVLSGKIDVKNSQAVNNPANFISGDILTTDDVEKVSNLPDIVAVSPLSLVAGSLKFNDKTTTAAVFGASPNFLQAMAVLSLDKGKMFTSNADGKVMVLGDNPRQALFGEVNPIGKTVNFGKEEFNITGTLAKSKSAGLFGSEVDSFIIIPFDTATKLNKNQVKIMRIIIKAADKADVAAIKTKVHDLLLENHDGEEDFTVLTQDDLLGLFSTFLNLATALVSAIAAISLIVGGIGIMNIMLVTVTERTKEIGLRKAVGATKGAILSQFLIEAIIITFLGALLGLLASFAIGLVVAAKTELAPVITPSIIVIAVGVAVGIGLVFGLWPALRAANKDPIEALRYE